MEKSTSFLQATCCVASRTKNAKIAKRNAFIIEEHEDGNRSSRKGAKSAKGTAFTIEGASYAMS